MSASLGQGAVVWLQLPRGTGRFFPSVSGCAGAGAALASHPKTSLLLLLTIIVLIRRPLVAGCEHCV